MIVTPDIRSHEECESFLYLKSFAIHMLPRTSPGETTGKIISQFKFIFNVRIEKNKCFLYMKSAVKTALLDIVESCFDEHKLSIQVSLCFQQLR